MAADAATFAVSAFLLARLRPDHDALGRPHSIRLVADLKKGWCEVSNRKWLSFSIGNSTLFSALVMPATLVLGPTLARTELGGMGAWSILMGAFGAGSLAGSFASLRVRFVRPAAAIAALLALASGRPAAFASGLGLPLIAAFCFAAGGAMSMASILWMSMLQQHVPTSVSRVDSIDDFGTFLLAPIGYLMAGPLAAAVGSTWPWPVTAHTRAWHARPDRVAIDEPGPDVLLERRNASGAAPARTPGTRSPAR